MEPERKFMDFLRIVIEGGWVVKEPQEWLDVFKFLDIEESIRENQ